MLENLNAINWQRLDHAYGEASDVPDLIRALTASDEETRQDALYTLYGNIWHRVPVYEATSYAVPFLIELLASDDVQGKEDLLQFLVHLANGHSYKAVIRDGISCCRFREESKLYRCWDRQGCICTPIGFVIPKCCTICNGFPQRGFPIVIPPFPVT